MRDVDIPLRDFKLKDKKYNLVGMTSIEGDHTSARYKAYLLISEHEWLEYDGPLVRIVPETYLKSQCALVLYYRKQQK